MKIVLASSPSFGASLFAFQAVAPIGHRGTVSCRWQVHSGGIEERHTHWAHPFSDEVEFFRVWEAGKKLPERIAHTIDGPGMFLIELVNAGDKLTRARMCWPISSESARAFDVLWAELIRPVETCLEVLAVPADLRAMMRLPVAPVR